MSYAQPFTDYEIIDRVGAGAMGTVFKARQKRLDRTVALKVLRPSLARNARYVDRLRREAHIVAQFNHPNIVTGYDLGEEGGYHFFVMEYVEGKALKDLLQEWGSFPEEQVLDLAVQVSKALDHAHGKGVIHRDIKPGNILIEDNTGRVKVTDLGLAKAEGDLTLTREGATVGTPQYISPEQARSPQDVDIRSDLYSLGATLYHMATGRPPFRGDGMAEVITKVLSERAPSAIDINPDLSQGLSLVIRKLMAKDPALRYQVPADLLADLERVQRNEVPLVDRKRLERDSLRSRREVAWRNVLLGTAAVALFVGAMALGAVLWTPGEGGGASLRTLLDHVDEAEGQEPERYRSLLGFYRDQAAADGDPVLAQAIEQRWADHVAKAQLALDREVAQLLGEPVGENGGPLAQWAQDPRRWEDVDEAIASSLVGPLLRRAGLSTDGVTVPTDLAEALDLRAVETLRERARNALAVERAEVLAAFDDYLRAEDGPRAEDALAASDFVAADGVIAQAGTGFFVGTLDRDRFPVSVQRQLDERVNRFAAGWKERIRRAEAQLAETLARDVEGRLRSLRSQLEGGVTPTAIEARIALVQRDLLQRYPGPARFRREVDPWPEVFRELEGAEQEVRSRREIAAAAAFADRLSHAYAALVFYGDAALARALLQAGPVPTDREWSRARDEHLGVMIAAQNVMDEVLRSLADTGAFDVPLRHAPGRPQSLIAERVGDRVVLRRATASSDEVLPSDVLFEPLLAAAIAVKPSVLGSLAPVPRARGRTAWRCVTDDMRALTAPADGADLSAVDPFVLEHVWPMVRRVREDRDRFGPRDLAETLVQVQYLVDQLRDGATQPDVSASGSRIAGLSELERMLAAVRRDFELESEPRAGAVVARLEKWVIAESARAAVIADVLARAPGAQVLVGATARDLSIASSVAASGAPSGTPAGNPGAGGEHGQGAAKAVEVRYSLQPADVALGQGWRAVDKPEGELHWDGVTRQGGGLADPIPLAVPDALPDRDAVRVAWRVRLPASRDLPFWTFRARGVALAVSYLGQDQALRTGLVGVADIDNPQRVAMAMQGDLRRALRASSGSTDLAQVIPGALHELALEIRPLRRDWVQVQGFLDGEPLGPATELRIEGDGRPPIAAVSWSPLDVAGITLATLR